MDQVEDWKENKRYEIPLGVRERHIDMLPGEAALVMRCKPMLKRDSSVTFEMDEFGYLRSARTADDDKRRYQNLKEAYQATKCDEKKPK